MMEVSGDMQNLPSIDEDRDSGEAERRLGGHSLEMPYLWLMDKRGYK